MYTPTTLGYAILGLLFKSKTGYQVRKIFETTPLGEFSSSPGSIYPALNRLLSENLITKEINSTNNKNEFVITKRGISIVKDWCNRPLTLDDVKNKFGEVMLKFVLMEQLSDRDTINLFLFSLKENLSVYKAELDNYLSNNRTDLNLHSRLALQQGIEVCNANYNWALNTLNKYILN